MNEIAAVLGAVALVITAIASLISAIVGLRNSTKIDKARHEMNGLKTELVETTRALGIVEGHAAGRADQKADDKLRRP